MSCFVVLSRTMESLPPELTPQIVEDLLESSGDLLVNAPETPVGSTLTQEELSDLHSSREFLRLLTTKNIDILRIKAALQYEADLEQLQIEMVKLQRWVQETGQRVAILFEGRDAAGKGGTIRRFTEHLNPRGMRVVALPAPTEGTLARNQTTETLSAPNEVVIAAIWSDILGIAGIGASDNFFDLGGHSLLAMQALAEMHARLGTKYELRQLIFESLGSIAAELPADNTVIADPLQRVSLVSRFTSGIKSKILGIRS